MAQPLLPDELWERIESLIPAREKNPNGGPTPIDNRRALTGIIFVLSTGIPWERLPTEMGCGSGMTCWRRLRDWQADGVWDRIHEVLLAELNAAGKIDLSRAAVDSGSVRAVGGGEETGPNPTDRSKPGSKHHVITDANGTPLQVELSGANLPDVKNLIHMVINIPPIRGKPGRPRSRPDAVYADRAYDDEPSRQLIRWLNIEPFLARRGTEHGSGMGVYRWVVERTIAWLHNFKRLRVRFDRRADIHQGFLNLAKSLICWHLLQCELC